MHPLGLFYDKKEIYGNEKSLNMCEKFGHLTLLEMRSFICMKKDFGVKVFFNAKPYLINKIQLHR